MDPKKKHDFNPNKVRFDYIQREYVFGFRRICVLASTIIFLVKRLKIISKVLQEFLLRLLEERQL